MRRPFAILVAASICLSAISLTVALAFFWPEPDWTKALPGEYEGIAPGLRERLAIKPDGTFRHQVLVNDSLTTDETGRWQLRSGELTVELDPFTEYYDCFQHSVTQTPQQSLNGAMFFLPYGNPVQMLSPSVHFDFRLNRKPLTDGGTNGLATPSSSRPASDLRSKSRGSNRSSVWF